MANISVYSRLNANLSIQEENVGKSMSFVLMIESAKIFTWLSIKIIQQRKNMRKHAKEIE